MKIWKKLIAVLMLVCFIAGAVPVAHAADEDDRQGLDYSELERQIGIANGFDYYDYTKETWGNLQTAVEIGNQRLAGNYDQEKVDKAAEDIAQAITELVKMDYSSLIDTLDEVYAKIDEEPEKHDVWYRLDKAVDKARPLLISGDQQAVNEMANTLKALLEELAAYAEPTVEPEIIIQEVEVEVPPTSDFCNMPQHRIWVVALVVSVAFNVLLVAALGYVLLKKRSTIDNTPLVDYDIEDDVDV